MSQLAERLSEIGTDRRVYLICRSGHRSGAVCDALSARGYDVVNVLGGTLAWVRAGLPYEQGS
jgi:rhodanese-related sulfurtransferase